MQKPWGETGDDLGAWGLEMRVVILEESQSGREGVYFEEIMTDDRGLHRPLQEVVCPGPSVLPGPSEYL